MSLEWILIGIAAVLLALNQGFMDAPNLRARLPKLKIPGWVNYFPFLLFCAALIVHFVPQLLNLY
jgi:hypothetical protein